MKKSEASLDWDTLAGRLRYLMQEQNMKQKEFAQSVGVSEVYISMLVRGRRDAISEPLCRLICQTYGVNGTWLMEGTGEPFAVDEAASAALLREKLASKMDVLDSAQLQKLLEMME